MAELATVQQLVDWDEMAKKISPETMNVLTIVRHISDDIRILNARADSIVRYRDRLAKIGKELRRLRELIDEDTLLEIVNGSGIDEETFMELILPDEPKDEGE